MRQAHKFSDRDHKWWYGRPQPRDDETVPFVGKVSGVTPAVRRECGEVRRRDVGIQRYGSGEPRFNNTLTDIHGLLQPRPNARSESFVTEHGRIHLPMNEPDLGSMPTADAVLFLRGEYVGSRLPNPPQRYYSR